MFLTIYGLIGLTGFLPGYFLYSLCFHKPRDTKTEVCAWSFALSVPVICAIHMISLSMFPSIALGNAVLTVGWIALLWIVIAILRKPLPDPFGLPLAMFAVFTLIMFFFLTVLPNYFLADTYDWRLYHPVALVYLKYVPSLTQKDQEIFMEFLLQRTPFFALTGAYTMSVTGKFYHFFQLSATFFSSLLFWAVFLISRRHFGKRTSAITALLFPLIPMFCCRINFPVPKALMYFFLLLTFDHYLRIRGVKQGSDLRRDRVLTAIFAVCAYMIHPIALFFLVWIAADQIFLWFRKRGSPDWSFAGILLMTAAVLAVPWYIWGVKTYGWDAVFLVPPGMKDTEFSFTRYLMARLSTVWYTLTLPPLKMLDYFSLGANAYSEGQQFLFSRGNYLLLSYFESLIAGFSLTGIPFFLTAVWLYAKRGIGTIKPLLIFVLLGYVTVLFVNVQIYSAQAYNMMGPLSLVLFIFLCSRVAYFPNGVIAFLVGLMTLETVGIRVLMFHLAQIYSDVAVLLGTKERLFLYGMIQRLSPESMIPVMIFTLAVLAIGFGLLVRRYAKS